MTFVYFARQMQRRKLVKIGMTDCVEERIYALQCEQKTPLDLLGVTAFETRKVARLVERGLHLHFDEHRVIGEWFSPSDEMLSLAGKPLIRFGAIKPPKTVNVVTHLAPTKHRHLKVRAAEMGITISQLLELLVDRELSK